MNDRNNIIKDIRLGKIDINNQELFFSILLKSLLVCLNKDITIRGESVPHFITHTGSDALYLEYKGHDMSIEPTQVSNENYIYTYVPRCNVSPGGVDLVPDQLTNPYTIGDFQYSSDEELLGLSAEYRRIPVKISVDMTYIVSSYRDLLELIQQVITKLSFIKTFNMTYMGQTIACSYKIPESFSGEHLTELDGTTQDQKNKTMAISIEVETNLPVISAPTVMLSDTYITKYNHGIK